jgi:hypothetical protein
MIIEPVKVYTPQSFLDSEHQRVAGSWFWKTMLRHVKAQLDKHTELALAHAASDEKSLRVAVAMASAFKTVLDLPELIRTGQVVFEGQIIGAAPKRDAQTDGDEDADAEAG